MRWITRTLCVFTFESIYLANSCFPDVCIGKEIQRERLCIHVTEGCKLPGHTSCFSGGQEWSQKNKERQGQKRGSSSTPSWEEPCSSTATRGKHPAASKVSLMANGVLIKRMLLNHHVFSVNTKFCLSCLTYCDAYSPKTSSKPGAAEGRGRSSGSAQKRSVRPILPAYCSTGGNTARRQITDSVFHPAHFQIGLYFKVVLWFTFLLFHLRKLPTTANYWPVTIISSFRLFTFFSYYVC